jgi:cytidylate kinase
MYRAIALAVLESNASESDHPAVAQVAAATELEFRGLDLFMNGRNVSEQIRSPEVTAVSSVVAANPAVRERLVELQREIGQEGSLVTEGRDQGSVVFPGAEFKFFLTATVDARARRRHRELVAQGSGLTLATVTTQLQQRDERDETRAHAPMKPALDARTIDTSNLSIAQVVDLLTGIVQA